MREKIGQLGGKITKDHFPCNYCVEWKSGGFNPDYGMELCANKLYRKNQQEDTMAHGETQHLQLLRTNLTDFQCRACACLRSSAIRGRLGQPQTFSVQRSTCFELKWRMPLFTGILGRRPI